MVATIAVQRGPWGIAFDGSSIWVTNSQSDSLSKVNPATNRVTGTITFDSPDRYANDIAFDGSSLWYLDHGHSALARVNPVTGAQTGSFAIGTSSAVEFDGTNLWVVADGLVKRIDPASGSVTAAVTAGSDPNNIAVDTNAVWVSNLFQNTVSRIQR